MQRWWNLLDAQWIMGIAEDAIEKRQIKEMIFVVESTLNENN